MINRRDFVATSLTNRAAVCASGYVGARAIRYSAAYATRPFSPQDAPCLTSASVANAVKV